MITGDSKGTAISIAKECGILNRDDRIQDSVFTGSEFDKMTTSEK
jgi:magnesium-transporting ATPase (P-type)